MDHPLFPVVWPAPGRDEPAARGATSG
jgi:hypothetical protein